MPTKLSSFEHLILTIRELSPQQLQPSSSSTHAPNLMLAVVLAFISESKERVAEMFLLFAGPLVADKEPTATGSALSLILATLIVALIRPAEALTLLLVFFTHRHSKDMLVPYYTPLRMM
jgi:hypothetical protein